MPRSVLFIAAVGLLLGCQSVEPPHCPHARTAAPVARSTSDDGPAYDPRIRQSMERALARLTAEESSATIESLNSQLEDASRCKLKSRPATGEVLSPAEIHAQAEPAVVLIGTGYLCGNCDDWHYGWATGFFISADGAIATNRHVVEEHGEKHGILAVMTLDGKAHGVRRVLAASAEQDVVILDIDGEGYPHLPIRGGIKPGEPLWVLGHPSGAYWYFADGMLGRRFMEQTELGLVETLDITATFGRGSSGSPLLDQTGAVVGLARTTLTVYAEETPDGPSDPQLVFRRAVPAEALLDLIEP